MAGQGAGAAACAVGALVGGPSRGEGGGLEERKQASIERRGQARGAGAKRPARRPRGTGPAWRCAQPGRAPRHGRGKVEQHGGKQEREAARQKGCGGAAVGGADLMLFGGVVERRMGAGRGAEAALGCRLIAPAQHLPAQRCQLSAPCHECAPGGWPAACAQQRAGRRHRRVR